MKILRLRLITLTCLLLGLFTSVQALASCTDFTVYPNGHGLGGAFNNNGYAFTAAPGTSLFVNSFKDRLGNPIHGVQFENPGLMFVPPAPAEKIELEIGAFNSPAIIMVGLDSLGNVVAVQNVPADDILHQVYLITTSTPIALVRMKGGGHEGVINRICM